MCFAVYINYITQVVFFILHTFLLKVCGHSSDVVIRKRHTCVIKPLLELGRIVKQICWKFVHLLIPFSMADHKCATSL